MKTLIKRTALAIVVCATICASLTGCTLYETEWTETRQLPAVETPITPQPWEQPPETDTQTTDI